MAAIWMLTCIVVLEILFLTTVSTQTNLQNIPMSQINNMQYNQQQPSLASLLSSYTNTMPFIDKIGAIANVIQKMPAKPGRVNDRQHMAEALKQSALESLMVAANACKSCNSKADGMLPMPQSQMTVAGDFIGNRAIKVKYV